MARRNPSIEVILYPTAVQGAGAAAEIVTAIERAGRRDEVDVLIVARGGGSIEDLWSFNDEAVARAIRACPIVVISGVGHDTDFTIADFVADVRAPTPTAAAELASPLRDDLLDLIDGRIDALSDEMRRAIEARMQTVDYLMRRLVHPAERIAGRRAFLGQLQLRLAQAASRVVADRTLRLAQATQRLARSAPAIDRLHASVDALRARVIEASKARLAAFRARAETLEQALAHLDPSQVLRRGYSIISTTEGRVVTDAGSVANHTLLRIMLARGEIDARVERARVATDVGSDNSSE